MEPTVSTSLDESNWDLVPTNALVGFALVMLLFYLMFRHFILVFVLADIAVGHLRKYSWFPTEDRRMSAVLHWLLAVILLVGFILLANARGWLDFIPQEPG